MAIDPSIALGVQAPKFQTPQEIEANRLRLTALTQQNQLQQEQVQQAQVQTEEMQRQQAAHQALNDALRQSTKVDPQTGTITTDHDAVQKSLVNAGYGDVAQQYQLQRVQRQAELAKMNSAQAAAYAAQHQQYYNLASAVASLPPEQKQAAWTQGTQKLVQAGMLQPNEVPQQVPDDTTLHTIGFTALDASKQATIQTDKQKADAATVTANARQQQAQTGAASAAATIGEKNIATIGQLFGNAKSQSDWMLAAEKAKAAGVSPAALGQLPTQYSPQAAATLAQQAIAPGQAASLAQGAQNTAIAAGRLGVERQRLATDQKTQAMALQSMTPPNPNLQPGQVDDAFLKTLPPATALTVKAISEGRMDLSAGMLRTPVGQNLAAMVNRYDQSFDAGNAPARFALNKEYRTGKAAQNLQALDTLSGHLDTAQQASNAVGGNNIKPLNMIESGYKRATGSPEIAAMNTAGSAVFGEAATVFKGTATEGEVKRLSEDFSSSNTPAERQAVLDQLKELASSRASALVDRYKAGTGRSLDLSNYKHIGSFLQGSDAVQNNAAPGAQSAPAAAPVNIHSLRAKYNY